MILTGQNWPDFLLIRYDLRMSDNQWPAPQPVSAVQCERWRQHSILLNRVIWQLASALGDIPAGETSAQIPDIDDVVRRAVEAIENET